MDTLFTRSAPPAAVPAVLLRVARLHACSFFCRSALVVGCNPHALAHFAGRMPLEDIFGQHQVNLQLL